MIYDTRYEPLQMVKLIPIDAPARVLNVVIRPGGIVWYLVEWWDSSGKNNTCEVQESDLTENNSGQPD